MSLSRHGGFLLAGASSEFQSQFLHVVTREARRLANLRPREPADQLHQAAALLTATLAFRGGGALRDHALGRTSALAAVVILPDGGHIDRSPKSLLELLADLLPLRDAMEVLRLTIPRDLNASLERALPMLRMLCHGDDGLAVFHGVEQTSPALVRAIFERDRSYGRPLAQASHSGYCRLAQGASLVIVDCGGPALCDSGLAFEFSDGAQRIAGSCGIPANASASWQAAARAPAAHSTAQFDAEGLAPIQSFFWRKSRRAPANPVTAELITAPTGILVKAHSLAHGSVEHRRELFLAAGGHDFRGEDRFSRTGSIARDWPETDFTLRFHLHPAIKASADRKGSSIMLLLPNKQAWQFSARGGTLTLEESIYLASSSGPRRSRQIVIRGAIGRPGRVNWAFRKLDRKAKPVADAEHAPRLPF
jgi:uncharacterized heparinase superfamily protein